MTDIDPGAAQAPPARRWRWWIAAATAVALAAVVLLVVLLRGSGDTTVRLEVTSKNNNVGQILWGTEEGITVLRHDQPERGSVATPWYREIDLGEKTSGKLVLTASVVRGRTDEVTCRLLVGGEVRAESTTPVGAVCDADIATILAG